MPADVDLSGAGISFGPQGCCCVGASRALHVLVSSPPTRSRRSILFRRSVLPVYVLTL